MHDFFLNRTVIILQSILITHIHISLVSVWEVNFGLFNSMLKYVLHRLMPDPDIDRYRSGRYRSLGMITVLIWKRACINL